MTVDTLTGQARIDPRIMTLVTIDRGMATG